MDHSTGMFFDSHDGKVLFSPWGQYGKGYEISAEDAVKIKKTIRKSQGIALLIVAGTYLVYRLFFASPYLIAVGFLGLVVCFLFLYAFIRTLLKNKKVITEKATLLSATKKVALTIGFKKSVLRLSGSSLLLFACSALMFDPRFSAKFVLVLGILIFGLSTLQSIFLVRYSLANRKK